ncbi:MAG: replication-associated recombination protein A [Traorella sp.]
MEPLAYRMRPTCLNEVIGQKHLIGENQILRKCVEKKQLFSMILYGPAGCGKTTLARVLANECELPYRLFNAVTGNKKDLDKLFEESKFYAGLVVIIDEVHRLNKDKQDLLLPYVESGAITLIGATTSNPLFAINPAIRSRCHLFEVKSNSLEDVIEAIHKAIESEKGLQNKITISDEAALAIARHVNGDIRYALNILEICASVCDTNTIDISTIQQFTQIPNFAMDKDDDGHYDAVSAFQKSIRGSDVNAALYYLARLILANDMDSIERRLITTAYEDIGLGNPAAVARCVTAVDAAKRVGFPEARIILSQAVIDLVLSPKSRSSEAAIDKAIHAIQKETLPIPDYLRLTPVNLSEEMKYDYSRSDIWPKLQYLPDKIKDERFYEPEFTSSYEKTLASNYDKLNQTKRTNRIDLLKKQKK